MKRLALIAVLFVPFLLSAQEAEGPTPPFNVRPGFEWVAPDWPAGQAPYWYFYGPDDPRNGPTPAPIEGEGELAARVQGNVHATGRWMAKARALPHPPPLPPLPPPPRHLVGRASPRAVPIIIVFRLF